MQNNNNKLKFISGALALIVFGAIGTGLWLAAHPAAEPIYGLVQARTVNVAAKVTGRIEEFKIREGDTVKAGQVIALLAAPELDAKLSEVRALQAAADAKVDLVDEGARPQEVIAAKAQLDRAQAGLTLAKKTFQRIAGLYKDGLIARQKYDEAKAQYDSALQLKTMAAQQYDIAKTGARSQEKSAVQALAQQARSGVDQVSSLEKEKRITTPLQGEISRLFVQQGELAPAGFPIVSVIDLSDQWIVFNVREDDLLHFSKGAVLKVKIPALGEGFRTFKVYFVNPRGDYATWRSTRQNSGYDLRTFEVRVRAEQSIPGLRPGMSAIIER